MANSVIEIEFLRDFIAGDNLWITIDDNGTTTGRQWTWVASRSGALEVTTGTPTGTTGEISATDFETAYNLDVSGYTTGVVSNVLTITADTAGIKFLGAKAGTGGLGQEGYVNITITNETEEVDISNVQFALVRSPHYVNTPFSFDTTTSATIDVFIWNGDLSAVPATATYTLTKVRPSIDYQEFNTNIAELMREQLDGLPTITLAATTQIYNSSNDEVKWLKYVASYTDPEETIADVEDTLIGTEGYGLYLEGVNPTRPTNRVLTTSDLRKVDRTGFIIIPFFNDGTITSINILSDGGEINETETPVATDNSNAAVQYLTVDVSATTNDNYIDITFVGSDVTFTYDIMDECRYEPKQFVFKNRWGLYDSVTMFKKSTQSLTTSNDDFTNAYISSGSYNTTLHQMQKINIQGKESLSCNTGYINQKENELYKEMMLSDKVFLYESGTLNPVNVKSSNLEFKTRVNDSLINYTIEFEYAYNKIQNV